MKTNILANYLGQFWSVGMSIACVPVYIHYPMAGSSTSLPIPILTSADFRLPTLCTLLENSGLRSRLVFNVSRTISAWTLERYATQLASILDGMR